MNLTLIEKLKVRFARGSCRPEVLAHEPGSVAPSLAYMTGDAGRNELDAMCLNAIARFKRPKDYVFVDELPKNNYDKILKTELRELDVRQRKV
jgi:acyl-coenzyme A synthetase/AMP-(fatty) acid ligase